MNGKLLRLFRYSENIILQNPNTFAWKINNRMDIDNILPKELIKSHHDSFFLYEKSEKIKVRIMYPSGDSWNNIHSLYDAFVEDDRYDTIVIVENYPRFIEIMKGVGCRYITLNNYDLQLDQPDIFVATFYSSAPSVFNVSSFHDNVSLVVAAIPNAVMNEKDTETHWKWIKNAYQNIKPDYFFVDKLPYQGLKGFIEEEKLKEMGNPQFDELYYGLNSVVSVPNEWEKIKGKTTFLWASDHGINDISATNGFSVDLYLHDMVEYFSKHTELALIFRPHPQLIREMLQSNLFWNENDYKRIRDFFINSSNMVWDDTHDFCLSYKMADAIMVDLNCSIICSSLTTGKPICRIRRNDIDEWMIHQEVSDCYYFAKGFDEIIDFIEIIVNKKDFKQQQRKEALNRCVKHFDGRNGIRMKNSIEKIFDGLSVKQNSCN